MIKFKVSYEKTPLWKALIKRFREAMPPINQNK